MRSKHHCAAHTARHSTLFLPVAANISLGGSFSDCFRPLSFEMLARGRGLPPCAVLATGRIMRNASSLRFVSLPRDVAPLHPPPPSKVVSATRTGLTAKLWQMRYDMQKYKNNATELQTKTVSKAPNESFLQIELLVESDASVRDQYLNFRGGLRFGKLLEDIDAFAGNIAFMHCNDGDPTTKVPVLVTACLDRLDINFPVTLNLRNDYLLEGRVNWTSKSSVQIDISLFPKTESGRGDQNQLTASMVFVHVQNSKAAAVNQVTPGNAAEQRLFAAGEAANARRKLERVTSLKNKAPTSDESEKLHLAMISGFGESAIKLSATRMEAVELMQPQERNRAGKIFGGFLMHEAYELAYATAASYAAMSNGAGGVVGAPTVMALDDVTFTKPVSIGDVVIFSAKVSYTGSNEVLLQHQGQSTDYPASISAVFQVVVTTHILDLKTGNRSLANEFQFTFMSRDAEVPGFPVQPIPVRPIRPTSYSEGMIWLDGRRRMIEALEKARENKGFAAQALFGL